MSGTVSGQTLIMLTVPKTYYGGYRDHFNLDISQENLSEVAEGFCNSSGTVFETGHGLRPFGGELVKNSELLSGYFLNNYAGIHKIIKPVSLDNTYLNDVRQAFLHADEIVQAPDVFNELFSGLRVIAHVIPFWALNPSSYPRNVLWNFLNGIAHEGFLPEITRSERELQVKNDLKILFLTDTMHSLDDDELVIVRSFLRRSYSEQYRCGLSDLNKVNYLSVMPDHIIDQLMKADLRI